MFKCGICNNTSKAGEKASHVVVETRKRIYPSRPGAHRNGNTDPGGAGIEIKREVLACPQCTADADYER